jgi:protein-disulfide isomerase
MNTKRIIFWAIFIIILVLIIWGLVVAMNKTANVGNLTTATPAEVTAADHTRGATSSPVTLIEYSDFQCPACGAYYPLVERLYAESSSTMLYVYRNFPLYPLPHKNAFIAAQAAEAAANQGKFWEMYHLLFENQTVWGETNTAEATFEGYAQQLGLNMSVYKTDFASDATKARVQHDKDEGISLGITGTPTFFVNGKAITNPQSYEQFKEIIDTAAQNNTK